jgi:hypothetical protein
MVGSIDPDGTMDKRRITRKKIMITINAIINGAFLMSIFFQLIFGAFTRQAPLFDIKRTLFRLHNTALPEDRPAAE